MTSDAFMVVLALLVAYWLVTAFSELWRNHRARLEEYEFADEPCHVTNVHYGIYDWSKFEGDAA